MKKYLISFIWAAVLAGCGDEEPAFYMCDCNPDQYCVDDKCYDTDGSIVPPPKVESPTK